MEQTKQSSWKKASEILNVIGSLSFITLLILNLISLNNIMKSNNYSNDIVGLCMTRYSDISTDLRNYNLNSKNDSINANNLMYRYFDLTNEELFYIRNGVVSPEVSNDWLTGKVKQLKKFKTEKDYQKIFSEYPRVSATFNLDLDQIDGNKISIEVIEKCIGNLKNYNSNK
jgi:hypothetical protein